MELTALQILQKYWGHSSFRGGQEAIITSVVQNNDTLALLPTGGGKSICFQVPALMREGLCLVVSPLIALIKDQVENLRKRNIPALALHSGMTFYEVKNTLQAAAHGDCKFLYLSPERLETNLFREYLHVLDISLIAVDEAHCISQWGYDFRPSYMRITNLRNELPKVPIIALTASATPVVQKDIVAKLNFKNYNIFQQSFEKPNLSYSVFKVDSKINKVVDILNNVQGSGIVYCGNRKQTKKVAELLQLQGISADYYHAGLSQDERSEKQSAWIDGRTRVVVCTNAFGMGIDKSDVRTVIHYDTPDCLENYYQEAGRGGRDGKRAFAVLLYQTQDQQGLEELPSIKFPAIAEIKKVYQSLADYLQIPVGIGEGNYYNFDLKAFITNFKLDIFLVMNVLKVLEHEGHVAFNESIFLPSQVQFKADKDVLNNIEKTHPDVDAVMKGLLRTYEGIYDNRVSINEKLLAKVCRLPYEKIYDDLNKLQAYGIIEYLPQKETPQLYFMLNRASAASLHIDQDGYFKRKQQYTERVEKMLDYMHLAKECRSKFISAYFGSDVKDCGICDICLQKKSHELTEQEFKNIEQKIFEIVNVQTINSSQLLQQLKGIKKEKIWKVFEFLQAEQKLSIDLQGFIKKQ